MTATGDYVVLMTTLGTPEAAASLSRTLVEDRLVACAQRVPIESVYRWEGAVVEEAETLLLLKTPRDRAAEAMAAIGARHPYEVPEILQLPVADGWPAYLRWMDEQTTT
ncbi:MAG: divalent-cation tolerance protein CutA [Acidimicrobiales bacterium]|nr:divalent-cation tolerance protein CutA [Acidimicrobiales bacterium]